MKIFVALLCCAALHLPAAEFNVRDYGAKGDRQTLDRAALQAALDACGKAGGGIVRFPAGDYLSGLLRISSGTTLQLDAGATLWASTNQADYTLGALFPATNPHQTGTHLLVADDAEHLTLAGAGTINGQGTADYSGSASNKPPFRVGILLFTACRDVSVRDVTIRNSDAWTLHFKRCETVTVDHVTIRNNLRRINSDGLDPNSCRHVRITHCDISVGDDCVVLKATEAAPCEDIVISDCTLETPCSALKLGTESRGDFRNIRFERCKVRSAPIALGLYLKDGGTMEDIAFRDVELDTGAATKHAVAPIFIDIERRDPDSKIGRIRNITFANITMQSSAGVLIQGMPQQPIENLTLTNVTLRVTRADDYAKRKKPVGGHRTTHDERDTLYARLPAYFALAHIRGLRMDDVRVEIAPEAFAQFPRAAVCGRELEGVVLRRVTRSPGDEPGRIPALDLQNCRDVKTV
ncbi:MAG: glycoside hydrolase family 28 protein, partial [Kiritimatiellaeota bacterium]|nr:glycoside hydrolase family 28 protein [Kiritimatiellota bacterium]